MLGIIGALIFGAVYAGAWMADEEREQVARKRAKETPNHPYYWDKNGKLRNAYTGRKYSTEDAKREIERKKKERADRWEKRYWGFVRREIYYDKMGKAWFDHSSKPILEIFNNYDDFKKYNDEMIQYYKDEGVDILSIYRFCRGLGGVTHFSNDDINNSINLQDCEVHYNFKEE